MRAIIALLGLPVAGCAAGAGEGAAPMTAIYSPPVRPGETGSMMFLPAQTPLKLPIEALPHASALIAGKGRFEATEALADAAACGVRLTAIATRAARRYHGTGGIGVMTEEDGVTILGPFTSPMRILRFRCDGATLVREDAMANPHPYAPPPPLPPIAR